MKKPPAYRIIPDVHGVIEPEKLEKAIAALDMKSYDPDQGEDATPDTEPRNVAPNDDGRQRQLLMLSKIKPLERGSNLKLVQQAEKNGKELYRVMGTLRFGERYADGFTFECYGDEQKFMDTMMINVRHFSAMLDGCGVRDISISFTREKPSILQLSAL